MTELAQATMPFLKWLAGIRIPFLDTLLGWITYLGDENLLIGMGLLMLWCVSKRCGYYTLTVGVVGTAINQFLKLLFRVPRPWLLDREHTIVESARERAGGWSFPSGHTQTAVGVFSGLALWFRKRWVWIVCVVLAALVAFSRMYLGVHTILDVGVSVVIALALSIPLRRVFQNGSAADVRRLLIGAAVLCALLLAASSLMSFPAELAGEDLANKEDGLRNLWLLTAAAFGLWGVFEVDERFLHYDTRAVWWAQLIKLALGLALTLGLKALWKKIFGEAYHDGLPTFVSYLTMILFAGCVWPMTFRFFGRLGRQCETKA